MTTFTPAALDAAVLRLAFEEAASHPEAWARNPMLIWQRLYVLVAESRDGLEVIAHVRKLEDEVMRLEEEVCRLNALLLDRPTRLPTREGASNAE